MKLILMVLFMVFALPSWGKEKGLGISLGNPTGLNGKYWLSGERAVDGGVGLSFGKHSNFSMHSDYLFHNKGAFFFNDVYPLDLHYGIGGRMKFSDDIKLGVRIPVGLSHRIENDNADIFGEVAPVINLVSGIGLELHLLIGARYYF
jgi:hypothetical protein